MNKNVKICKYMKIISKANIKEFPLFVINLYSRLDKLEKEILNHK